QLTLTDGSGAALASWTGAGDLKLQKSTAKLSFPNVSLAAATGSASTVTLPAVTGTAVVSNSTAARVLCGNVTIDPTAVPNTGSNPTTVSTSPVALAANDACTCTPRTDWGAKIIQKYCSAGANSLTVMLYSTNASGSAVDPPSTVVDYCCTRK